MRALLTLLTLIGIVGLAAAGASRPAGAQAAGYTYFPTSSTTDARFLAIASSGLQTLSGNKVTIGFAAGASTTSFEIGVFDGNTAENWDLGSTPVNYTLYADPQGNGSNLEDAPDPVVVTWSGAVMPDSAWFDIPVVTGPEAEGPTGDYFYYLTVTLPPGTPGSVCNGFKLRTTGTLLLEAQSIGLISQFRTVSDRLTVYPDWDNTSYFGQTSYNGTWDIFFDVPTDTQFFSIWDGDSDFGSFDGLGVDTNDPDTPGLLDLDITGLLTSLRVPVWAGGSPAVAEAIAGAAPQDDNGIAPQLRRSPAIQYGIETPDGDMFWNDNPSGNLEWEQFMISREPFDRSKMDYHADSLSAGRYRLSIIGFDMGNLNAFRFLHDAMGVNAIGDPVKPIRPYWTLGDRVWRDLNNNGQDDGEPGITNVKLSLLDGDGAPVLDINGQPRTTVTGPGGFYRFNVTATGIYTVKVDASTIPEGLSSTSGGNRRTYEVVRTYPQQSYLEYDFGYGEGGGTPILYGRLGDRVWLDADLDGVQDAGETGIPNVLVLLLNINGDVVDAIVTGADGKYDFAGLAGGTYHVVIDPDSLPAGLSQTYDLDGGAPYEATVLLAEDQVRRDVDFGYGAEASVGDIVWVDEDCDCEQGDDEQPIPDVTVTLMSPSGAVATTVTDEHGLYLFEHLTPGDYSVVLSDLPAGLMPTYDLDGLTTPDVATFSLAAGDAKRDVDFGYVHNASVGDRVWDDVNLDGIQNASEAGIAGVTVTLTDADGAVVATTATDVGGLYLFEHLAAGSYSVRVSDIPSGFGQTFDLDGLATGNKASFTLMDGEMKRDVDFGYGMVSSVGDRVWLDADRDGVQDSGELGLAGVTATLLNADGAAVAEATTDANGLYLFDELTAGSYSVALSDLPAGLEQISDLDGVTSADTASFTLSLGEAKRDVDFGYAPPQCSVGDRVWLDEDRDGVQDVGENGIAGATVKLLDSAGAAAATTTTDANGHYLFERLDAGSYSISVSGTPSGAVQTFDLDGTSTASKASFSLAAGDDKRDVDFGYAPPFASVGDRVWKDTDRDGVQDSGETGLAGVAVRLLDASGATVANTTTDASGLYLFDQLEAGSYAVFLPTAPSGLTQTFDLDGLSTANKAAFTLSAGDEKRDVDFGYATPPSTTTASVGDRVWKDTDLDGVQDSGEPGIAGVTVKLKSGTSYTTLATATTDANGEYLFSGLSAGSYTVYVSGLPSGLLKTFDLDGISTADKAAFSLAAGQAKRDVDFGYGSLGCLGNRVWFDCDLDGVQDSNEGGLGCVTVKLYTSSGAYLCSTNTSSSGYYEFDDLPAGTYKVVVSGVSSGLSATFDRDGVGTVHQATVTLAAGQCRTDVDFGYGPAASVGDRVWKDTDGDRCQDSGEPGIAGVTVKLLNSSGSVLATTTTDSNGYYLFAQLAPATYSVTVANLPAGYTPTYDLDGTSTPHKVSGPLGSGEHRRDVDFGYRPAAPAVGSIGDKVWFDCDLDGVQDSNEGGLGCVTVKLLNSSGGVLATTTTNSSGSYLFSNLAAGSYSVVVSGVSSGLAPSHDLDGISTGGKTAVSLTVGQNRRDVDFGYGPYCSVGNRVWKDTDGDRCQDSGETGIAGVTVKLLNTSGGVLATTTTDSNGYYLFNGVAPGSYAITVSGLPSGYTQTYDLDGTGSAHKASFGLSAGDDRTDVDFGYKSSSSSSGSGACSNSRCSRTSCSKTHGDSRECDSRWCDRSRCSKGHSNSDRNGCENSRCSRSSCDRSHGDNRDCSSSRCGRSSCDKRHDH